MKKYILGVLGLCLALGYGYAYDTSSGEVNGDVNTETITCTDLTYMLKLRSRDASTNNEVTKLQEFLQDVELLDADPSGYFGVTTQKAVKTFQRQNGLLTSGLVGPITRKAIKERSCGVVQPQTNNNQAQAVAVNSSSPARPIDTTRTYSSINILNQMVVRDPVWSALDANGRGTISLSITNIPQNQDIDYYTVRFFCRGISLPRNGGDLCGTQEKLRNLNLSSFENNFPYTVRDGSLRMIEIELKAYSSSHVLLGRFGKASSDTRNVSSSRVLPEVQSGRGLYEAYLNGRLTMKTENITRNDAYSNCVRNGNSNRNKSIRCTWSGEEIYTSQAVEQTITPVSGPKSNAMSCQNGTRRGLSNGSIACYGVWDYGDEFGNDQNMCPSDGYSNGKTGCIVSTPVCSSGKATATRFVVPSSLSVSSSEIETYASNLRTSKEAVKTQLPGLWEYTCTGSGDTTEQNTFSSPVVNVTNPTIPVNENSPRITVSLPEGGERVAIGKTVRFKWTADNLTSALRETNGVLWAGAYIENTSTKRRVFLGDAMPFREGDTERLIPTTYDGKTTTPGEYKVVVYLYAQGGNRAEAYSNAFTVTSPSTPVITSVSPTSASVGKTITVFGSGFALNSFFNDNVVVKISSNNGQNIEMQSTTRNTNLCDSGSNECSITVAIPDTAYPGVYSLTVKSAGLMSNSLPFTVTGSQSFKNTGLPEILGASTMCVNLSKNIHRGDETDTTRMLQQFLITHGFLDGDVTGFYGDKTILAVKSYQKSKGLKDTGMVYEATRLAIKGDTCQ